jgi:hypothetical protein
MAQARDPENRPVVMSPPGCGETDTARDFYAVDTVSVERIHVLFLMESATRRRHQAASPRIRPARGWFSRRGSYSRTLTGVPMWCGSSRVIETVNSPPRSTRATMWDQGDPDAAAGAARDRRAPGNVALWWRSGAVDG